MDQIGRYELLEEIGRGGMGTVHRARDARLLRDVALKLLPAALSQDPTFNQRFQREAQIIAQLEHPHIVPVYDAGVHAERPFLVMRLLRGGTLQQRLAAGRLTPTDLAQIISQVALALDAAYAQGIVHRDVKPSNILFDEHGTAFVADFGVAKIVHAATQLTGSGVVGTPAYISPEHVTGQTLDGRSDQYSLAIVAYEALTGELPFKGELAPQLIYQRLESAPPAAHLANPALPPAVTPVLAQGLAKTADERFRTSSAFAAALAQALATPPPATAEAVPPAPLPAPRRQSEDEKSTAAKKLQRLYNEGLEALAAQEWETAVHIFARLSELQPDHPKVRSRYEEAQQQLKLAQRREAATGRAAPKTPPPAPPPKVRVSDQIVPGAGGRVASARGFSGRRLAFGGLVLLLAGSLLAWVLRPGRAPEIIYAVTPVTATWTPAAETAVPLIPTAETTPTPPLPAEGVRVLSAAGGGSWRAGNAGGDVSAGALLPFGDGALLPLGAPLALQSGAGALALELPQEAGRLFLAADTQLEILAVAGVNGAAETALTIREGRLALAAGQPAVVANRLGSRVRADARAVLGVDSSEQPLRFAAACLSAGPCILIGEQGGAVELAAGQASFVGGGGQPASPAAARYETYHALAPDLVPAPTATPTPTKTPTAMPTAVPTQRPPTSTPVPAATNAPIAPSPPPPQPTQPPQPTLMPTATPASTSSYPGAQPSTVTPRPPVLITMPSTATPDF